MQVFKDIRYILLAVVTFVIVYFLFELFTYKDLIIGNYGFNYYIVQITTQIIISFLFAVFLTLSAYKFIQFSNYSVKEGSTSFIATFFGILAAGCPACSITLASYIGVASLLTLFPYGGLELKVIAIPMLLYANYSVSSNLMSCKMPKKHKI